MWIEKLKNRKMHRTGLGGHPALPFRLNLNMVE